MSQGNSTTQLSESGASGLNNLLSFYTALLAILSAITALLATFAIDYAMITESDEIIFSDNTRGVEINHLVLKSHIQLIELIEKPVPEWQQREYSDLKEKIAALEQKTKKLDRTSKSLFDKHDRYIVAITMFQLGILITGLVATLNRPGLFGLSILSGVCGLGFMIWAFFA